MNNRCIFRGKRKDNGECVYGNLIKRKIWASEFYVIRVEDNGFDSYVEYEVIPETVGEFTGLVNVGGRKIFEGDIAQWENRRFVVRRECDTLGGSWSDTAYILDEIGVSGGMSFEDTIDELNCEICVEIIGNIHDDPELLKGE